VLDVVHRIQKQLQLLVGGVVLGCDEHTGREHLNTDRTDQSGLSQQIRENL